MLRAASLAALALLAAVASACGGSAAAGRADPASAVPADAPFYFEVVVRPGGRLRDDALDAAGKVLRTDDPSGKLSELLEKALRGDGGTTLDYKKDIEPWLGERAGGWAAAPGDGGDSPSAVIVAITDRDAAQAAVDKAGTQTGERSTKRSYQGADYEVDENGAAVGITGDFLIAGQEAQLKRTLDTLNDGRSLADSDRYSDGADNLTDDRLGHFYVDFKQLLKLGFEGEPNGQEQLRQFEQLVPVEKIGPLMGSFAANGDRLALDMTVDVSGPKGLGALGNLAVGVSTPLLKELPGDTWGAFGAPKYGASLSTSLDQFAGAFGGVALKNQLRRQYGIDLEDDVLSWIGDVAFFIRGNSVTQLDGGAVIQVTDGAKAATGFSKLVGLLQSETGLEVKPVKLDGADIAFAVQDPTTPKPIVFARGGGKVVIAYGNDAAAAALAPSDKFGDAEIYGQAKEALEDDVDPSVVVSMPSVLSLVRSIGSTDAGWEQAKPYLEAYDVIAVGAEAGSKSAKVRIAAGLK